MSSNITKPNEKCHCVSGKKYKKCCKILDNEKKSTATTNTTLFDNIMTMSTMLCYHKKGQKNVAKKATEYQEYMLIFFCFR